MRAAPSACCRTVRSLRRCGAGFADLKGSGPVTGELAMYLPIKEFDRRVITVMATLDGIKLQHQQQPIEAERRRRASSGFATGRSTRRH